MRLFSKLSLKEQTFFAQRLSFLLKAHVPLPQALRIIRDQSKSKAKQRLYANILDAAVAGKSLARSLHYERLFDQSAINLVYIGEQSGALSNNLEYLAEELRKRQLLRSKILGALLYPFFITVATIGITSALVAYIFPKLTPIFVSLHVELPLTTRILMATSDFLRSYGIYTLAGLLVVGILFFYARQRYTLLHYHSDALLLHLPLVSGIVRSYNAATFTRTLRLLLRSGLSVVDSIEIIAGATNNRVYARAYASLSPSLAAGEPLHSGLTRTKLFPDLLIDMTAVGEASSDLIGTLGYLTELYENEIDDLTKNLSSAIEPALMLMMGALVGLIATSVVTPIYSITQHLQTR